MPKPARRSAAVIGLAAMAAGLALFGWLTRVEPIEAVSLPRHTPDLANGARMFHAGGCASCHGADLGGGLELVTAFGSFHVPNISPHPERGIGGWSEADFVSAMKRGVSPDGEHYYPAFPYTSYAGMDVPDLLDLKAWLDTVPALDSTVPPHDLRVPWNLRRGIGLWKRLYLDDAPVLEVPAGNEQLARGRYLVESVGHCAECHTPRDALGGLQKAQWMAGGANPDGDGRVPNITPHSDGLQAWSEKDIARYLKSGFTPDYDTVGGSMAKVQENLARLPEDDRAAIVAYLRALPPRPDAP